MSNCERHGTPLTGDGRCFWCAVEAGEIPAPKGIPNPLSFPVGCDGPFPENPLSDSVPPTAPVHSLEDEAREWLKSSDLVGIINAVGFSIVEMLLSRHVGASGNYLCELLASFARHAREKGLL